jgi:hypothetical protein
MRIYRVDTTNRIITYPDAGVPTAAFIVDYLPGRDIKLGVAIDVSDSTTASDTVSVFTGDTGAPGQLFRDFAIITDSLPVLGPGNLTSDGSVAIPGGLPGPGLFDYDTDLNTYSYSGWGDGGYTAFTRNSGGTVTEIPGSARIDAVLSDGRLYSRGMLEDRVYLPTGELELSIPTGRLRFAYEIPGTEPTMIYTVAYFDTSRDYDYGNLFVEIYSIPTADLALLE